MFEFFFFFASINACLPEIHRSALLTSVQTLKLFLTEQFLSHFRKGETTFKENSLLIAFEESFLVYSLYLWKYKFNNILHEQDGKSFHINNDIKYSFLKALNAKQSPWNNGQRSPHDLPIVWIRILNCSLPILVSAVSIFIFRETRCL